MKLLIPRKIRSRKAAALKPAAKRSQLLENSDPNPSQVFNAWLIRTGVSPEAGLPASRIGIYTDFD